MSSPSAASVPLVPRPAALSALRRAAPVLPVVAVIALLGLPGAPDSGASPADLACGLVVLWAAVTTVREARRPLTRSAAVVLGLPVVGIAAAATGAVTPGDGITGLARYLQVFVLFPLAVVLLVRDRRDARLVLWSLAGLALWQGAVGVHQFLTGTGASYQGADIRAVGTFGPSDVMGMASVVACGVVALTGLALGTRARRRRLVAAGCALALLVPLALSFSRGAWIATAVACGTQLLLAGVRRAVTVFAAAVAAAVVLVGGLGVGAAALQERLTSITQVTDTPDQSVVDRYTMWAAATDMWHEHPVTGVGLKAFPAYRDAHASLALSSGSDTGGAGQAYRRQPLLSPHNMYLLLLSEQGLLGLLTVAGSWLALLVCALRGLRRAGRARDCALAALGLLLWQLVNFLYSDIGGPSTTLTAVCFGLVAWWSLAGGAPTGPGAESGTW
ncbi:O-antigen ligase family protein [Streptomyces sp. NBC_00201]|uniref:O-antigen ligase family protein n=1 Tax=unclassified Streptomyces TaxID=2593676 RepID=UPI00225BA0A6|nr:MULTISPECIES: O-antigen ligase family protein [unclassified Streptomyces]MCX5056955.1 O-antigen ligase family protein [Streptomyces sp. NBC_00452]MCX5246124.1 O-antigen ligase family protein [Streptomyces sp. NBC_00201]MCX5288047.1 O-antigen ligase family protein [Streptomyces sp. NBC_00183]